MTTTSRAIDMLLMRGECGDMTTYDDIAQRYIDPMAVAEGREAITATIAAAATVSGLVFRLAGTVDGHHNQARFTRELGPAGEPAAIVGFDITLTDEAGRINTVLGFLDRVPAAA